MWTPTHYLDTLVSSRTAKQEDIAYDAALNMPQNDMNVQLLQLLQTISHDKLLQSQQNNGDDAVISHQTKRDLQHSNRKCDKEVNSTTRNLLHESGKLQLFRWSVIQENINYIPDCY